MMKLAVTKLLLAGALAFASASVCFSQTRQPYGQFPIGPVPIGLGVCVHHLDESPTVLRMIYESGFRYVRIDLKWNQVEARPAVYGFSAYDRFFNNAAAAGLKVMFILDYANPLYDGGFSPYTDAGTTAFAKYAVASVTHFQNRSVIWEMYNEPTGFWKHSKIPKLEKDADADVVAPLYAAMAIKAGRAIKAKFPKELLVGPALPRINSRDMVYFNNTISFTEQMLRAGAGNDWDYFTVHPYHSDLPEAAFADLDVLRSKIAATSPSHALPLADSEWGYSTTLVSKGGKIPAGDAEIIKSKRLARALLIDRMQGMPFTFIYDWMDDGIDPKESEHNYGLVEHYANESPASAVHPLPAFYAVKTFVSVLTGLDYDSRIDTGDPTDYVLRFTSKSSPNPRTVWVCWNRDGQKHEVAIPVEADAKASFVQYDGSSTTNNISKSDSLACMAAEGPQYVVLDGLSKQQRSK